ncbi:MAG TPA: universal stress protein [Thermoleophilia bacterium]|nr:universal stress protein [Thermoleophilia bacterium]
MAFDIVIGYEGSEGSKAALDEALRIAGLVDGTVYITYAFGGPRTYSGAPLTPRHVLRDLGEGLLKDALDQASGSQVRLETVLVDDNAVDGLLAVAQQHGAELIVVGTHGESPIRGALLGSTAYKLVHSTTRPILVVPELKHARAAA